MIAGGGCRAALASKTGWIAVNVGLLHALATDPTFFDTAGECRLEQVS
ncbi:hypothetical protein DFP92_11440 [Yoonia sediminilitoris]|uniref:Uncharacterized protein n=1 Tax=Yoonia sediminilitoris TaxID=1286148 RepID=A0A2T6K915_9RHOB|nr:hypothetical protein C8N45_11440 [Yoonia sediminilitoris]RCW91084.1 hypothetical protein DFP92_11440 [Yoonia sediminilitoris]